MEDKRVITDYERAVAMDEQAEEAIDTGYLAHGNLSRPFNSAEDNATLPNRAEHRESFFKAVKREGLADEENPPFTGLIKEVTQGFDKLEKEYPKSFEAYVDFLVAKRDLRQAFPKDIDFPNFMELLDSAMGFGYHNSGENGLGSMSEAVDISIFDMVTLAELHPEDADKYYNVFFAIIWKTTLAAAAAGKIFGEMKNLDTFSINLEDAFNAGKKYFLAAVNLQKFNNSPESEGQAKFL